MARIITILILLQSTFAFANPKVVTALVHSDQTYILDQNGQSLQEFGIGDTIYLVIDSKDKKRGHLRVTFDPTDLQGHGWVEENKVRILTQYRSADGKLPSQYDRKYTPGQKQSPSMQQGSGGDLLSGELTFIEELINREQGTLNQEDWDDPVSNQPMPQQDGQNPFEEDLEFLFSEDEEFKDTFESAKNEHFSQGVRNIGISSFSLRGDQFAKTLENKFRMQLNQEMQFNKIVEVAHVESIETANRVSSVSFGGEIEGVFFGILSPKVGNARLFKIKYYDTNLKQFLFEKVVNIPLDQSIDPSVQKLVSEVTFFLRSL